MLLSAHVLWYCERDLLSVVYHTMLFEGLYILEDFTSCNFDFFHYISTLFVHVQVRIQGKSQVFEVVDFVDLFIM